ncbi:MAG: hypothetical protein ACOYEV_18935 [Candidatus Nanopelagicales bacterium]
MTTTRVFGGRRTWMTGNTMTLESWPVTLRSPDEDDIVLLYAEQEDAASEITELQTLLTEIYSL